MDVIGGGLLVAVAATLWIAYLLPSWLRRRQDLATEHNAVRLQQTLRILAETAETPEPVRIEATAREVAVQQRILHEHEQARRRVLEDQERTARLQAEAAANRARAERLAAEAAADAAARAAADAEALLTQPIEMLGSSTGRKGPADAASARRARRRRRAVCSLLLLISMLVTFGGLIASVFGASLVIASIGAGGVLVSIAGLVVLAPRRAVAANAVLAQAPVDAFEPVELDGAADTQGWTPQPLPRPLHLSRGTIAATAMASVEAAAALKRAETEAAMVAAAERAERRVPVLPAARRSEATAATPSDRRESSPYARMGIIDRSSGDAYDLDAVLRRRRDAV